MILYNIVLSLMVFVLLELIIAIPILIKDLVTINKNKKR